MEEVTLTKKFTKWNVYRVEGNNVVNCTETSKPMTPSEALEYFNANAINGIE